MITRNRAQVITNPYQGDAKKVLCVCSAGVLRSPTAAYVLAYERGYNTRAVGIEESSLIRVEEGLLHWADEIVCMGLAQELALEEMLKECHLLTPILNLGISDIYNYMEADLQDKIHGQYAIELKEEKDNE